MAEERVYRTRAGSEPEVSGPKGVWDQADMQVRVSWEDGDGVARELRLDVLQMY